MPDILAGEVMVGSAGPQRTVTRNVPRSRSAARVATAHSPVPAPASALPFTDPQPAEGPSAVTAEAAALGVEAGVAAFVRPPPMEVGKFTVIKFVAGPSEQAIGAETEGAALTASTAVYVAKAMRVTLIPNSSFEIKASTEAKQTTGLDKTATWLWDVKPLDDRTRTLEAEIEIYALNDDDSFGRRLERYTRQVEVEVRVGKMTRAIGAIDDASTIGEKLTGLFGTWQKTIAALVALLGAIGLLAWKLGFKRARPVD